MGKSGNAAETAVVLGLVPSHECLCSVPNRFLTLRSKISVDRGVGQDDVGTLQATGAWLAEDTWTSRPGNGVIFPLQPRTHRPRRYHG